jgi:hypothetical protein
VLCQLAQRFVFAVGIMPVHIVNDMGELTGAVLRPEEMLKKPPL